MYIPEVQTPRLIEIQFTILPEDEWLLGISDLAYFQGIGFSLPIPFDEEMQAVIQNDLLKNSLSDPIFNSEAKDDIYEESDFTEIQASTEFQDDLPDAFIDSSKLMPFSSPDPVPSIIENALFASIPGSSKLYAFLPGFFYCSKHDVMVDGVLVEVTHKEIFGQTFANFKPEFITSFDIQSALTLDEEGEVAEVEIDMSTAGRFATGVAIASFEDAMMNQQDVRIQSIQDVAFTKEIQVSKSLLQLFSLSDLKRAYVSGPIVTGQLMTLLHDIETNGLTPRYRLYVKNTKYPEGKVVEEIYQGINGILDLEGVQGILTPEDMELMAEVSCLSFAKLVGWSKEVDIETAVMETQNHFRKIFGDSPSKDNILRLIFRG